MLIQLPNGNWVDHGEIVEINALDEHTTTIFGKESYLPPRVVVACRSGGAAAFDCADFESAKRARDKIARDVLAACGVTALPSCAAQTHDSAAEPK